MSSWGTFNEINATIHPQNSSGLLPTSLFYHMELLLDSEHERYNARFEDMMDTRMRDLTITRSLEQDERQEEPIDIDAVLANCMKETYIPKHLSRGSFKKNQQEECSICLERFEANDKLLRLPCNHLFHIDCILPWIKSNHDKCPFCRAKIVGMVKRNQVYTSGPLTSANNAPQNQSLYSNSQNSTRDFYGTSRNTSINIPFLNNNAHINRDLPTRIDNVPQLHPLRLVSSNPPHLPSSGTNNYNVSTSTNYGTPIRDIPIYHQQRQPYYYGPPTREITTSHHGPLIRDIPISHHRPPNYPHNLLSRGGYTRRHGSTILVDFGGDEEATSAMVARLSFWV